jgi:putative FmdB family regulatory protein
LTAGGGSRRVEGVPTYEYRCKACQREFEVQHRMNDPDLVHCDACGADALERLISWTSVRNENWQRALYADNPKEAFKGISAVDRSRSKRFGAADAATPAPAPAATPANDANTDDDDDDVPAADDKPSES